MGVRSEVVNNPHEPQRRIYHMKIYYCCKHCGNVELVEKEAEGQDNAVIQDTCSKCHDEAVMDLALGFSNLKTLLNKYSEYDYLFDEYLIELGCAYKFKLEVTKLEHGIDIRIWDDTERFNMDLDDEINSMIFHAAKEFGFDPRASKQEGRLDKMIDEMTEALRKDLGMSDFLLEWEDGYVLSTYISACDLGKKVEK